MSFLIYAINCGTYFVGDLHERYKIINTWCETHSSVDSNYRYQHKVYNKERYFDNPISDGYVIYITPQLREEFLVTLLGDSYWDHKQHGQYYSGYLCLDKYRSWARPRKHITPLLETAGRIDGYTIDVETPQNNSVSKQPA